MRLSFAILASLVAIVSAQAQAQPTQDCELHVWSTSDIYAVDKGITYGPSGSGVLFGYTLTGVPSVGQRVGLALQPATQLEEIRAFRLDAYSGLAKYRVIYHEEPSSPRFRNWLDKHVGEGPRLSDSHSRCYAELHVIFATLLNQPMKKILQTIFIFRDFGAGEMPRTTVIEGGSTTAPEFKFDALEKSDSANADLRRAFRANLGEFLNRRKMKRLLSEQ